MSSRDNPNTVGNRVKSARMLSGHSRQSFAKASEISMATLRAWEDPTPGRCGLTKKGAKRLVRALNGMGIFCTEEWLLAGSGPGPKIIHDSFEPDPDEVVDWGEEESILKDIESFKKNNPDPIVAIVADGSMLPKFSYGDYVGGNKVYGDDIKSLIGTNCIVEITEKTLIRRVGDYIQDGYTLTAINQDPSTVDAVIVGVKLKSAAEIVWHRWRKKIRDIKV